MTNQKTELEQTATALSAHERFVVTTHENPDGDALGSLLATTLALRALGKDVEMYLHGEVPLPNEYEFMALDGLVRGPAPVMEGRVLVAVDCANESRLGPDPDAIIGTAELVVNIDHHHDNSLFGDDQPDRRRGVVHGGDPPGRDPRGRRRRSRRRSPRRSTSRSSRTRAASSTRTRPRTR